jgi:hypothetical protein
MYKVERYLSQEDGEPIKGTAEVIYQNNSEHMAVLYAALAGAYAVAPNTHYRILIEGGQSFNLYQADLQEMRNLISNKLEVEC